MEDNYFYIEPEILKKEEYNHGKPYRLVHTYTFGFYFTYCGFLSITRLTKDQIDKEYSKTPIFKHSSFPCYFRHNKNEGCILDNTFRVGVEDVY